MGIPDSNSDTNGNTLDIRCRPTRDASGSCAYRSAPLAGVDDDEIIRMRVIGGCAHDHS